MKTFILTLLSAILLMISLTGCSSQNVSADDKKKEAAYYCRETKKIIVTTKQEIPAINPKTGKKTLFSTMYCEQCKKWRPVPPMEILQRNPTAGICSRCKKRLVPKGPLPEKTN